MVDLGSGLFVGFQSFVGVPVVAALDVDERRPVDVDGGDLGEAPVEPLPHAEMDVRQQREVVGWGRGVGQGHLG